VIFSHSSAKALVDHARDVPDNILTQLPKNGGLVMITFVPGFVSQEVTNYNRRETDEQTRVTTEAKGNAEAIRKAMDDWHRANIQPRATIARRPHRCVKKVAGIDHVGLGGDFDGITGVVLGLEDVSKYPDLVREAAAPRLHGRRDQEDHATEHLAGDATGRGGQVLEQLGSSIFARGPHIARPCSLSSQ
jgi:membrane dipeptidase